MKNPFTFFNLNLSNYNMREYILLDSIRNHITFMKMAFILLCSIVVHFPFFPAFLLDNPFNKEGA